ncbi:MAG: hypothetical protein J7M27_13165 [Candidatus Latescibacteria bacterium]|nr:hypothetical protein [Candidatus Latescibacterota bacterium]
MPRTSHNDSIARRKRLLDFFSETLEDQVRQLEELVRTRVPLDPEGVAHSSESVQGIQPIAHEAPFLKSPSAEVQATGPDAVVLRGKAEFSGAYPMTLTLAEIYASQGLMSEAITVLKQILKREPEREEVRHRLNDLLRASSI